MKTLKLEYAYLLPLLLLCATFLVQAFSFEWHDFANYYFSAKLLGQHAFNESIYFPHEFNQAIASYGQSGIFASFAPNSPFLALLFYPLSLLPIAVAKVIFNGISIFLLLFSLLRMTVYYHIRWHYLLLVPILFLLPIRNELLFGQVYFLLFFLIAESWLAYEKNQFTTAGLLLAFAILIKIFPVLLLLLFIFRKDWKPLLFTGAFVLIGIGVSALCVGLEVWAFWLTDVLPKASAGEIATAYVRNYQSVHMFLKELLVFDPSENPYAVLHCPKIFSALIITFKLLLVGIGFFVTRKQQNGLGTLAFWIFAMLLWSPYGSTYGCILLLFPFLFVAQSQWPMVQKGIAILLLLLVNEVPPSVFLELAFPFNYWRLLVTIAFFGLILFSATRLINWKIVSGIAVSGFVMALIFARRSEQSSLNLLGTTSPILIYDYQIAGGQLTYFYWNENGKAQTSIPFRHRSITALQIAKNQIVYKGKPLTSDRSHKRKAIVIDGNTILFLSDKDRGIGFFTLLKMRLP